MRRIWLATMSFALATGFVRETASGQYVIRGTLRDGNGGKPLRGAVVEIERIDSVRPEASPGAGRAFGAATLTDSTGRFRFSGLPRGVFALAIQHHILTGLGIDAPVTVVELGPALEVTLSLSTPTGTAIRASACRDAPQDGLIAGYVFSSRGGAPAGAAVVTVEWDELRLGRGRLATARHRASASPDSTGRFHVCGVPIQAPVVLRIEADGHRAMETELALPGSGVFFQDFHLPEQSGIRGRGVLVIRVADDSGAALLGGVAMLGALDRKAPIAGGVVGFSDLPEGTWAVQLRALGFAPAIILADAEPAADTISVRMERLAHVLDAVPIVEMSPRNLKVLDDVERRMRAASGTLIRPDNLSLRNATLTSEALVAARGFFYKSTTVFEARNGCRSTRTADTLQRPGFKEVAVYLDGSRFRGGLQTVNELVRPEDIIAIEAYPDVTSAPFLWRTNDACAVVAFWTRW